MVDVSARSKTWNPLISQANDARQCKFRLDTHSATNRGLTENMIHCRGATNR